MNQLTKDLIAYFTNRLKKEYGGTWTCENPESVSIEHIYTDGTRRMAPVPNKDAGAVPTVKTVHFEPVKETV
jgi:hypothetical protein